MPEKPFATQKKPKRIGPKTQEEDGKNSANELSQLVNKLIKNASFLHNYSKYL